MRNVLITGAGGFLGRHFLKHHLDAGDRVVAIDDMSAEHAVHAADEALIWKTLDIEAGLKMVSNKTWPFYTEFDIAYHFASPVGGRLKIEYDPFFNADAFRQDSAFFRWAAQAKPKRVVYPSSSAVYPVGMQMKGANSKLHIDEVDVRKGKLGFPDSTYGFAKLVGEHQAYTLSRLNPDMKVVVIRPFSGYGPGQPADYPMTAIIERALRREDPLFVWGSGEQQRDFVYVDDIVEQAVYDPMPDFGQSRNFMVRNIGTGRGVSFIGLAKMVAAKVGYSPDIATLIDKPVGVHYRVSAPYRTDMISLEDGVERTIRYYEKKGESEWTLSRHA